jgi:hypothetical protein
MNIYEHDETAVGELDKRRIPVLNGEIFCSPFCGAMCKKSDYDNAVTTANEIAVQLGDGWVAQVFENLGWHWLVKKGSVEVRMSSSGYYNATMQFNYGNNFYVSANDQNPRKAVQEVRDKLLDVIKKLERQYASSALEPILISTSYSV